MQAAAQFGQGAAGAGDLFGMAANAGDQLDQVAAQVIERVFDIAQLAGARVDADRRAEVAAGPLRQRRHQTPEHLRQAPLDPVDDQGDKQDQADHQALDQPHFALDTGVFGLHHRLQRGQRLL